MARPGCGGGQRRLGDVELVVDGVPHAIGGKFAYKDSNVNSTISNI